jgi:hypothetical protein
MKDLPKEKAMFPALTNEFIKAENEYRHERTHRSFVEHGAPTIRDRRGHGSTRARRGLRPLLRGGAWAARSL